MLLQVVVQNKNDPDNEYQYLMHVKTGMDVPKILRTLIPDFDTNWFIDMQVKMEGMFYVEMVDVNRID